MHSKTIIAIFAFVAAAAASPTGSTSSQCTNSGTVENCCDKIENQAINFGLLGLINVPVGIGCVAALSCNVDQKAACCESGAQYGLINVGTVCPQIL